MQKRRSFINTKKRQEKSISEERSTEIVSERNEIGSIRKEEDSIIKVEYNDPITITRYKDLNMTLSVLLNNSCYNHEKQIQLFSVNFIYKLLSKGSPNEKSILLKKHINKKIIVFPTTKNDCEIKMILLNNRDYYYFIILSNKDTDTYEDPYQQITEYIIL